MASLSCHGCRWSPAHTCRKASLLGGLGVRHHDRCGIAIRRHPPRLAGSGVAPDRCALQPPPAPAPIAPNLKARPNVRRDAGHRAALSASRCSTPRECILTHRRRHRLAWRGDPRRRTPSAGPMSASVPHHGPGVRRRSVMSWLLSNDNARTARPTWLFGDDCPPPASPAVWKWSAAAASAAALWGSPDRWRSQRASNWR